jgi:hypothetical protein
MPLGKVLNALFRRFNMAPAMARRTSRRSRHRFHQQDRAPSRSENGVPDGYGEWWDENFAFIAGHTEGGAPYGLTWEQVDENGNLKDPPLCLSELDEFAEDDEENGNLKDPPRCALDERGDDDEIPF